MSNYLKHGLYQLILGLFGVTCGILLLVFSSYSFMKSLLGYLVASLLLIFSLIMIVITFFKESEHFLRVFFFIFLISLSIYIFLEPTRIVDSIPILLGVFLVISSIIFIIKFLILKKANFKSSFVITELIICLLVIAIGVLLCVFSDKIDVYILTLIFGIPLILLGACFIFLGVLKLIRHR